MALATCTASPRAQSSQPRWQRPFPAGIRSAMGGSPPPAPARAEKRPSPRNRPVPSEREHIVPLLTLSTTWAIRLPELRVQSTQLACSQAREGRGQRGGLRTRPPIGLQRRSARKLGSLLPSPAGEPPAQGRGGQGPSRPTSSAGSARARRRDCSWAFPLMHAVSRRGLGSRGPPSTAPHQIDGGFRSQFRITVRVSAQSSSWSSLSFHQGGSQPNEMS